MAERRRIALRDVRGLAPSTEIFDADVTGFGARRRSGRGVSYFVMFRNADGRLRRYTIGTHGAPWTPDTAREKARAVLAEAKVHGGDPAAEKQARRLADTVSELCDAYLADAESGRLLIGKGRAKKPSTLATDRSRIDRHIRPLLGAQKVPAVTAQDVQRFMVAVAEGKTARREKTTKKRGVSNVRGGRGAASRTVGLLGAIFSYAVKRGMRPDNPVTGTLRYADGKRERRMSDAEYLALGRGLEDEAAATAAMWPAAVAATRFLALTGWRRGEALGLRWSMVDLQRRVVRLDDTKTGASLRPLAELACDVLRRLGPGAPDALVFPASRGAGTMSGFRSLFGRIARAGGLPSDVTPHVLRHSFASLANDLGYSEATIGMLVGHRGGGTTRGYIHAGDAVFAAADRIAAATIRKMEGEATADVVAGPGAQGAA
jgi:integrase